MKCSNCNSEIKGGMKFCPQCGLPIKDSYKKEIVSIESQIESGDTRCPISIQDDNSPLQNKWISTAIFCIVLIIIGNSLNIWGGVLWGIGGIWVFMRNWGWKTWKPYISLFALYVICGIISGGGSSTHYDSDAESISGSNILGSCKYCGATITIDSPHECSNVCSRPECKRKYDIYMSKSMFEHVNGKGSWDREVNKMQEKFSHY